MSIHDDYCSHAEMQVLAQGYPWPAQLVASALTVAWASGLPFGQAVDVLDMQARALGAACNPDNYMRALCTGMRAKAARR